MARDTEFDHDKLAHLLSEHLLTVPHFQRSYSWDDANVGEYLDDIGKARDLGSDYFMGTVVLSRGEPGSERMQIVDGQQRLATTAVLLIAIRDLLRDYGKREQADSINNDFLRGYVRSAEGVVEKLQLSPADQDAYLAVLDNEHHRMPHGHRLGACYDTCMKHLRELAPTPDEYDALMSIVSQLEGRVQILVAVASDLPEAYVIFETLNDRGADLTTADLLKNYLFSHSGDNFNYVQDRWLTLERSFMRADDFVQFLRYEYVSRNGRVLTRNLYKSIQNEVSSKADVRAYLRGLTESNVVYSALRDPDSEFWSGNSLDVRDALLAYKRFGFESSMPLLLAVFRKWKNPQTFRFLNKLAKWSVRAQFAGRLGSGVAELTFAEAARKVNDGTLSNQVKVRTELNRLIPTDTEFKAEFTKLSFTSSQRAKYILGCLESAMRNQVKAKGQPPDWNSRQVTIEHVLPVSMGGSEERDLAIQSIGNLTVLESRLNKDCGSRALQEKATLYRESSFLITNLLAELTEWNLVSIESRTQELADLAVLAWPSR